MPKKEKIYKKLPGKGVRFGNVHTLWEGPGYLLNIDSHGYIESYKRFYFKDIEELSILATPLWIWFAVFLTIPACLFLLGALYSPPGLAIFLYFWAAFFFNLSAANFYKGPTCKCRIRTAVQETPLLSLTRIKSARKAFDRIEKVIAETQGILVMDDISAQEPFQKVKAQPQVRPGKEFTPLWHRAFFLCLVCTGVLEGIRYIENNIALTVVAMIFGMLLIISGIIALVHQSGTDIGLRQKSITWFSAFAVGLNMAVSYIIVLTALFKHPTEFKTQIDYFEFYASITPEKNPLAAFSSLVSACLLLLCGILGLVFTSRHKKSRTTTPLQESPMPEVPEINATGESIG